MNYTTQHFLDNEKTVFCLNGRNGLFSQHMDIIPENFETNSNNIFFEATFFVINNIEKIFEEAKGTDLIADFSIFIGLVEYF